MKKSEQKLQTEISKREAWELKLQESIRGVTTELREQFNEVNGKFDQISDALAAIQLQLQLLNGNPPPTKSPLPTPPSQLETYTDTQITALPTIAADFQSPYEEVTSKVTTRKTEVKFEMGARTPLPLQEGVAAKIVVTSLNLYKSDKFVCARKVFDELLISTKNEHSFEKAEINEQTCIIINFEVISGVIGSKDEFAFRQKPVDSSNEEVKIDLVKEKECISDIIRIDKSVVTGFIHDRGKEFWVRNREKNEEIEVMKFKEEFGGVESLKIFDKMHQQGVRPDGLWHNMLFDGLAFFMDFELHEVMLMIRRYSVLGSVSWTQTQGISVEMRDLRRAYRIIDEINEGPLRRWRQAALFLNASRWFRYTLDLKKQEEKKQLIAKIRTHAQVIWAAVLFQGLDKSMEQKSLEADLFGSKLLNVGAIADTTDQVDDPIRSEEMSNPGTRVNTNNLSETVIPISDTSAGRASIGLTTELQTDLVEPDILRVVAVYNISEYGNGGSAEGQMKDESAYITLEPEEGRISADESKEELCDKLVSEVVKHETENLQNMDASAGVESVAHSAKISGESMQTSVFATEQSEAKPVVSSIDIEVKQKTILAGGEIAGNFEASEGDKCEMGGNENRDLEQSKDNFSFAFACGDDDQSTRAFKKGVKHSEGKSSCTLLETRNENGEAPEVCGSSTEKAIMQWGIKFGMDFEVVQSDSVIIHAFPFNSEKRPGGVALKLSETEVHAHWKRAAKIILASCTSYIDANDCVVPMDEDKLSFYKKAIEDMAAGSLRCVAIAYRLYEIEKVPTSNEEMETWRLHEGDLILLAIVGITDPCRPGVSYEKNKRAAVLMPDRHMCLGDKTLSRGSIVMKTHMRM